MIVLRILKRLSSLGIVLLAVSVVAATAALAIAPQVGTVATSHEGTAADLELNALAERSSMYASDGGFLTFLSEVENREPIELDQVPQEVVDAILAMEDADFYSHDGVNLRGTFRALVENLNAGGIAQGGSTITQQLVKNSILTTDQNLGRKSTEAFYALRLERQMTKDEILERYLNTVYFGAGAYGVQAAAETYWGYDNADQLGWAEAAMLAGIIRNPTLYDPTLFPEEARARRSVALDRLVATEHISEEEAETYGFAVLPAERQTPYDIKPTDYFIEEALQALLNDPRYLGGDRSSRYAAIYRAGLKVWTTFDPDMQAVALATRDENLPEGTHGYTMAIATVDNRPETAGAVRAVVGGREFERNKFNAATQADRSPGSTMKTFVLGALFEAGYGPSDRVRRDTFIGRTASGDVYEVECGGFGYESIAAVTRSSNNCAFVRLGQVISTENVANVARRLGVDVSEINAQVMSLPLGTIGTNAMEMAGAYAGIYNDGKYNEPWYIERIEDRDGNVIYEHRADWTRAISQQSARLITDVLESNVQRGTGTRARVEGHAAAGKTGTNNKFRDAWFVGYTGHYSTAIWLGDLTEERTIVLPGWGTVFGGELPAQTWGQYMTAIHEGLEPIDFEEPDSYRGGQRLKVEGEIDYCESSEFEGATRVTELIDSNNDGRIDCFRPVASTTTSEVDGDGDGDGDGDDDGAQGTTTLPPTTFPPTTPPPTVPPPTTQPQTTLLPTTSEQP